MKRTKLHAWIAKPGRLFAAGAASVVALLCARDARAQQSALSRFSLHGEGGLDFMVHGEPARRFGPGGHASVRLGVQLIGPLSLQVGMGNWWFSPHAGPVGHMISVEGGLRFAPRVTNNAWGGPVIDANVGAGFTGDLVRFSFNVSAGWEFVPTRWLGLGPVVRYTQIVQPDDQSVPDDAAILSVGLGLTLRVPPPATQASVVRADPDPDKDGVLEERDFCPMRAEDQDGFEDEVGCPEFDNDNDGFPDTEDRCRNEAETRNGFEDADGCPDTVPAVEPPRVPTAVVVEPALVKIADRVNFGTRSANISRVGKRMIGRVCAVVQPRVGHAAFSLEVIGHADERGTVEFNQWLSDRRAHMVADAIVEACGIPSTKVVVRGMGRTQPLCTEQNARCHSGNRRVEFVVRDDPPSTPSTPGTPGTPSPSPAATTAP